ncbi:TolC family protein [bacterium]|nr:TolC family protein [bacterium]
MKVKNYIGISIVILILLSGCNIPGLKQNVRKVESPSQYNVEENADTTNSVQLKWSDFYKDSNLVSLIDSALYNNQELNIMIREIEKARNEIQAKKGEYLPFVGIRAGSDVEKVGRYTSKGAMEATTDIEPGKPMPEPVPDQLISAYATWEIDIWHKLRNGRKAAAERYLASVEGRNFMLTNLVSEIAKSYYELLALDNQLRIVRQTIAIQTNALRIVKLQKQSAKVTELAVRKFEAEVLKTKSLRFDIQQRIVETENRINLLVGRYPQAIPRDSSGFMDLVPVDVSSGLPAQLLQNRPDIRAAEYQLKASKLDVAVARANFYPSLSISAALGLQAFNPLYLTRAAESMMYSLGGELLAPVVNRKGIIASYKNANASQIQAAYEYQKKVLTAYLEVANQLSNIENLRQSYDLREQQVEALSASIKISIDLFQSARANYMEVLLTQRDMLDARFELVETKMKQMNATVNVYRALGGGWK